MTGTIPPPPPGFQRVPPAAPAVGPWTRYQQAAPAAPAQPNPFAQFAAPAQPNPFAQFATPQAGAVPPPPPGFVLDTPAVGPWTRYQTTPPAPAVAQDVPASVLTDVDYGRALLANTIPQEIPRTGPAQPAPREPSVGRSLTLGAQGVGRGVADIAGAPADISTAAANLGLMGADALVDLIFAEDSPEFLNYRFPPSALGSDAVAGTSADIAEALGLDLVPREEMSASERMIYEANRFGTGAAVTGASVAAAGNARRAGQLSSTAANDEAEALDGRGAVFD